MHSGYKLGAVSHGVGFIKFSNFIFQSFIKFTRKVRKIVRFTRHELFIKSILDFNYYFKIINYIDSKLSSSYQILTLTTDKLTIFGFFEL